MPVPIATWLWLPTPGVRRPAEGKRGRGAGKEKKEKSKRKPSGELLVWCASRCCAAAPVPVGTNLVSPLVSCPRRPAAFNLFVRDKLEEFKAKGVKAPEPKEGEKAARNPLFRCGGGVGLHSHTIKLSLQMRAGESGKRATRCSGEGAWWQQ